jgi:hypothetical protein
MQCNATQKWTRFIDCAHAIGGREEAGSNSLIGRFDQARRKKQTRKGFAQRWLELWLFEIWTFQPTRIGQARTKEL